MGRPEGIQEGSWRGPYLQSIPLDPWGEAYHYRCPGLHGPFDLYSSGRSAEGQIIANWDKPWRSCGAFLSRNLGTVRMWATFAAVVNVWLIWLYRGSRPASAVLFGFLVLGTTLACCVFSGLEPAAEYLLYRTLLLPTGILAAGVCFGSLTHWSSRRWLAISGFLLCVFWALWAAPRFVGR